MMNEKLIRCICGAVYDTGKKSKCPECSEQPGVEPKLKGPAKVADHIRADKDVSVKRNADFTKTVFPVRIVIIFAVFILGIVFLGQKAAQFINDKKKSKSAKIVSPTNVFPQEEHKEKYGENKPYIPQNRSQTNMDRFQRDNGILPPAKENTRARISGLESAMVGTWQRQSQNNSMSLNINSNGQYALIVKGPNASSSHSGNFKSNNGLWELKATTTNWTDYGKYYIGGNMLTIIDKNGDKSSWEKQVVGRRGSVTDEAKKIFNDLRRPKR